MPRYNCTVHAQTSQLLPAFLFGAVCIALNECGSRPENAAEVMEANGQSHWYFALLCPGRSKAPANLLALVEMVGCLCMPWVSGNSPQMRRVRSRHGCKPFSLFIV